MQAGYGAQQIQDLLVHCFSPLQAHFHHLCTPGHSGHKTKWQLGQWQEADVIRFAAQGCSLIPSFHKLAPISVSNRMQAEQTAEHPLCKTALRGPRSLGQATRLPGSPRTGFLARSRLRNSPQYLLPWRPKTFLALWARRAGPTCWARRVLRLQAGEGAALRRQCERGG